MTGTGPFPADLVVLVPDKNMESAVKGILDRPQSLNVMSINFHTFIHIERDPGCFNRGHDFLKPMISKYRHAVVMLDREGCGHENWGREAIEQAVETNLSMSGWGVCGLCRS